MHEAIKWAGESKSIPRNTPYKNLEVITLIFLQSHDWLPRIAQIEMLQQSLQKVFPQLPQGQIEITFVDASISQSINAEQRGKNAPTDVLSFSYLHDKILDDPHELLGEIFLCDSIIEQQAQEYGHTPQQEVLRLM
jgi:ssRNA-specific RNase YbeY (16S rRNA maturation enzyme)